MDNRKTLQKILQQSELEKFAQQTVEQIQEGDTKQGEEAADKIFNKLLEDLDFDSID